MTDRSDQTLVRSSTNPTPVRSNTGPIQHQSDPQQSNPTPVRSAAERWGTGQQRVYLKLWFASAVPFICSRVRTYRRLIHHGNVLNKIPQVCFPLQPLSNITAPVMDLGSQRKWAATSGRPVELQRLSSESLVLLPSSCFEHAQWSNRKPENLNLRNPEHQHPAAVPTAPSDPGWSNNLSNLGVLLTP